MTVLATVEQHRAVQPHCTVAAVLEQQLVEVDVVEYEAVVGVPRLLVFDVYVHGFAAEVLGATYAVDARVHLLRAEGTVDVDRSELRPERFQQYAAEVFECCQLKGVGCVVYAVAVGPRRARHFVVTKVRCQHKVFLFHGLECVF